MGKFKRFEPAALFAQAFTGIRKFDRDLLKILADLMTNLSNLFDRGLSFSENMDNEELSVVTHATPDTEIAYTHTLGRIPSGFFVVNADKAGVIYAGTTAWTNTQIYLRSNVATVTARVIVY